MKLLYKIIFITTAGLFTAGHSPLPGSGFLEISVHEAGNHAATPAVISIAREEKLILEKAFNGRLRQELASGEYRLAINKGPEYRRTESEFVINHNETTRLDIDIVRQADMKQKGWWSGETHIHSHLDNVEMHMLANDMNIAPVLGYWTGHANNIVDSQINRISGNRIITLNNWEDEGRLVRPGAVVHFNIHPDIAGTLILDASIENYSRKSNLLRIKDIQTDVVSLLNSLAYRSVPVLLATGKIDAVEIASHTFSWDMASDWPPGSVENQLNDPANSPWWRSWKTGDYPVTERGKGLYYQDIYYHVLNCGLRLPPGAGTAIPVNNITRLGYNRVYVHTGPELNYETWWENLKSGKSFVTNGPLLTVTANNRLPGAVFPLQDGKLAIDLDLWSVSNDPIETIEIIKNGKIYKSITPGDKKLYRGNARIEFDAKGWFLVRVITDVTKTFRFASSAPFYVGTGTGREVIDPDSVRFFLEWIREEDLGHEAEDYFRALLAE